MATGNQVSEICIVDPILRYMNAGNLKIRRSSETCCTFTKIQFLDSASLKLHFDISIVFVQTRHNGDRKP